MYMHRHRSPADGAPVRAFLATPAYEGISPLYVQSLVAAQEALAGSGIELELAIFSGNCHVDDSRNRLVRDFLETDCTDLVFLDADIGWGAQALAEILSYDRDIVAGVYPLKQDDGNYPVICLPGNLLAEEDGLVEVEAVPTGFLRIRRRVLEVLNDEAQKFPDKTGEGRPLIPLIFERTLEDGKRWGGDYQFCRLARKAGYGIYVNPEWRFRHGGLKVWEGSLGEHWRVTHGVYEQFMAGALQALSLGQAVADHFRTLHKAWGNQEWSASPEFLCVAHDLAKDVDGPILEAGSGLSSLVLAASTRQEVHVLEHSPIWATAIRDAAEEYGLDNLMVHYCPLWAGWYDVKRIGTIPTTFALVICDGPPRSKSVRSILFDYGGWFPHATVLMDDAGDPRQLQALQSWSDRWGRDVKVLNKEGKAFALAYYPNTQRARAA